MSRPGSGPHTTGNVVRPATDLWRRAELPTWAVAAAVYLGWMLLTWYHAALAWWLVLPLGGYLVCWHGSLQHEAVHDHPTRRRWLNTLVAYPPLALWLPYPIYREIHLAHHRDENLTCPIRDPESFYVTSTAWGRMGKLRQGLLRLHNTLPGRLLFGPLVACARLVWSEITLLRAGDWRHVRHWMVHAAATTLVLAWLSLVCAIPIWEYVLLFAYPGLALTLLRSFAEHRAAEHRAARCAVVDAGWMMSLLYLNNNLHGVHHRDPARAWFELRQRYRAERMDEPDGVGDFRYRGYGEILRRHMWKIHDEPVHPVFDHWSSGPRAIAASRPPGA